MAFIDNDLEKKKILFPCDVSASHFCDQRMLSNNIDDDFMDEFEYYIK